LVLFGRLYRDLRDAYALSRLKPVRTRYGFTLIGGNYLAAGDHEQIETDFALKLLKSADLLVDVGANSGLYSCLAASLGASAIAIEPDPANVQVLCRNIEVNQFGNEVAIFPVAVGEHPGVSRLYGRGQGSSLVPGWGGQPKYDYRLVPVHRLDDLVRGAARRIFLKIDTEGTESSVLRSATKTLERVIGGVLELSHSRNHPGGSNSNLEATDQMLRAAGFQLQRNGENVMFSRSAG
jgi:FkbM family methyltransferase